MSNESRWRRSNGRWVGPLVDPINDGPTPAQTVGAAGAAPAPPEPPQGLLGPDGNPLPEVPPLPFGFTA